MLLPPAIRMKPSTFFLGCSLAIFATHCSSSEDSAPPVPEAVVQEGHVGTLVVSEPARASFVKDEGHPVRVRGTGASKNLRINDQAVQVGGDGSFEAMVTPERGLNIVVAVDGESRLELPFLYGAYASPSEAVPAAVAIDLGADAIEAPAPEASLSSVVSAALDGRDLVGLLKGKEFSGEASGATFEFEVLGGKNGAAAADVGPASGGIDAAVAVNDIFVEGDLTIVYKALSYKNRVKITASKASVTGTVKLSVEPKEGELGAAMPNASAKLENFKFDTNNGGFPCCVDKILTGVVKPKIEEGIATALREQLPKLVALSLHDVGIPRELDLSGLGLASPIPIDTRFDRADFDGTGGTLSVSALFGGTYPDASPAMKVPGWLKLGQSKGATTRASSLGVSISLDAVNQFFFAAWGTGTAAINVPKPFEGALVPGLPPVVSLTEDGALRVAIGEMVMTRKGSSTPLVAISAKQDIVPSGEDGVVVLTPKGDTILSLTWMSDETDEIARSLVASAAKDQLKKFLKPFRLTIPKFKLDALGGKLVGQSLAIGEPVFTLDANAARVSVTGPIKLVQ